MLLGYKNGGKARRLLSRKLDSGMPTKNSYIKQDRIKVMDYSITVAIL